MIEAACTAFAVVVLGAALRPRPVVRTPNEAGPEQRRRRRLRPRPRRRPRPITAAEVAVWCEALARVIRSGSSLAIALRSTEPPPGSVDQVDRVMLALDRGSPLVEALQVATMSPHLDLAFAVLRACAANGGPAAEPLDRAAAALRGRAAARAERQTQSAQAQLSAIVMTVLPIAMLALLLATSATTRAAAASPIGLAAVGAGGALNVAGWRWMRRIIERVAS